MSTTQAQAAVMESTAAKFERVNESLESMLKRLMDELDVLRGQWQGAGGRSFEQVKQAWAKDQAALHRALAETAEAIRAAGKRYHSSDTAAADRVGAAQHGPISLPL
ncbi:MAG TPA: WXG100 family type VII secretion target [Micromonosporaceae bacterium]